MRPSELLDERDPYVAFCLDRAITTFGRTLEDELESIHVKGDKTGKKTEAKRNQLLAKWLPETNRASNPASRFKDPAARR